MPPDPSVDAVPMTVVLRLTARRAARSGALWGLVFGLYVVSSVTNYAAVWKTAADRAKLAATLGTNAGLAALLGPARRLDTVAGWTTWRAGGVLAIVGAIWGLLAATRLTRAEEEAGRWELLLAGLTTRRRAAAQALTGLAAGLVALWAVTAAITVAEGNSAQAHFGITPSLFLSVTLVAAAGMFLAIGALAGQVAATRRQANGIAAGVFGLSFLLRTVADSGADLEWLRWATPLGWVEQLRPLTGSRPTALVPIVATVLAAAGTAIWVAGRRDLDAAALPARDAGVPHTRLLSNHIGLAARLARPVAVGWTVGMAVLGLVGGLVAQSAANAVSGSATIERAMARLGAHRGGAASYLGVIFLTAAGAVAFAAAGQLAATRAEEAEGHLDHLLARPVGRGQWLLGRAAVAASVIVALGVVAGLAAWVGAASQHSGVGLGVLLRAGLNLTGPALCVLGLGALALAVAPRTASLAAYTLVAWSFLIELVGSGIRLNHWLLDTSLLAHLAPAPAASPNWVAAGWLVGFGVAGIVAAVVVFDRRDLAGE